MRTLAVLLLLFFVSPFARGESTAPADAETTRALLETTNSDWSYLAFLHGTANQAGVGAGFQTPLLWETLGLRVDYAFNRVGNPGGDPLTYSVIDAGIKVQLAKASSLGLFPYLLENFNFFLPRDAETTGAIVGFETCYGLELRHVVTVWGLRNISQAVFVELGLGASDLRARPDRGGSSIGDGLVARLGFRRFL